MSDTTKREQNKGDDILKRMLKMPPDPRKTPDKIGDSKAPANTSGDSRGEVKV